MSQKAPTKKSGKKPKETQAVKVAWEWASRRNVKKSGLANYSDHLGTVRLDQLGNPIRDMYARNWHVLKPSSFRGEESELVPRTIKRQVVIIIPAIVVEQYTTGRRPANKGKAIQRAITILAKCQQPINAYTVNGLVSLDRLEASPRYIYGQLKALDFTQAYYIAKVPYWAPKAVPA